MTQELQVIFLFCWSGGLFGGSLRAQTVSVDVRVLALALVSGHCLARTSINGFFSSDLESKCCHYL